MRPAGVIVKLCLFTVCMVLPAHAHGDEPTCHDLRNTVDSSLAIRAETGRKEDDWEKRRQALVLQYRKLTEERDRLASDEAKAGQRINMVKEENARMERMIAQSDRIEKELDMHLTDVVRRLRESINNGLPFLRKERTDRIDALDEALLKPETSLSEKYRRVAEVLRIEAEYGHGCEVYRQSIVIDGQPAACDILRLGRVALFYCTPDGTRAGMFDPEKNAWVALHKERSAIKKAVEMASKQRSIEFVQLPIGRITAP